MLNFRAMRDFVVLGGGTAGWFAALELHRLFGERASITVVESPRVSVIGVGEGGILNLPAALQRYGIDEDEFASKTGAVIKLGFEYAGWNTGRDDETFYHLFHHVPQRVDRQSVDSIVPWWAMLVAHGIGVQYAVDSLPLILDNASQDEVRAARASAGERMPASMHFDAHRVAAWLKQVATSRGIALRTANVLGLDVASESGWVRGLRLEGEEALLPVDFMVDASGFARMALQRTYGMPMRSFGEHLILDRAIPFYIAHPRKNPRLVTRSLAMNAGWMWQIPEHERVGCGYVFSSAHIGEDEALAEIEARLGQKVEPERTISFSAGHFEDVWVGNVMAVGLASGFIEPLEATSIGQMLGQVCAFGDTVAASGYVVPRTTIRTFNHRNRLDWEGIRDFLRLHYDVRRRDTAFWRDVTSQALPESYAALKEAWQHRLPRTVDLNAYRAGHVMHFDFTSWMAVGQGVGVIPEQAAAADLAGLPRGVVLEAHEFMKGVTRRFPQAVGGHAPH
ncbi:tryptophan halogenase [Burkholderia sp. WAC0059]|uniref:tryptophan 7-halogenase n=1 Tax=Burkholderia sp. WAC0059 TaxID=2066022 RepID=UPI000C7F41BC|nr:tryptophan 7-halogenase [Burkholderia sp. WAC0059]PLZ04338.1 tryptophan halogenase [Burkholderia sp. WAC0059]